MGFAGLKDERDRASVILYLMKVAMILRSTLIYLNNKYYAFWT